MEALQSNWFRLDFSEQMRLNYTFLFKLVFTKKSRQYEHAY
uniref:Uncharacterized protein n=1 Tax=Anguilla anguilla TaxID=7936 RepID=A0A0E9S3P2_ANGAN